MSASRKRLEGGRYGQQTRSFSGRRSCRCSRGASVRTAHGQRDSQHGSREGERRVGRSSGAWEPKPPPPRSRLWKKSQGPEAATRTQSFAQDAVAKGQNVVSAVASKGQEIYGARFSRAGGEKRCEAAPDGTMTSARRIEAAVPASPRKSPRTPRSLRLRPPKRFRSRSLRKRRPAAGASEGEQA